jgi:hypothetical protein
MITALRSKFKDTRGRAPGFDGMPFVFIGKASPETPHLHSIDLWDGEKFLGLLACDDEIFHDGRRAA